ncbi:hypothetical protein CBM2595_A30411 [Cupriavidus taiwanensis]|nr:hypothetical protein CBM2595_A30411 [Cupriavidus taiwanensis]
MATCSGCLRHAGADLSVLDADLTRALAALPAGATSISDFSFQLESAIERAWVYATLAFSDDRVRGAYLLAALLKTPELRRTVLGISSQFAKLRPDDLVEMAPALIAQSPESREAAYDGSGLVPATPGEASGAMAPASAGKSALGRYCRDLTEEARAGRLDPVIGREHEIRTMTDILLRRRQNNPLLTGEAGVGKTAVIEGLALAVAAGEVPPSLKDVRLLSLDVGALLAGASMKGEFEARLKGVLEEAAKSPAPVILFVDEVHTLVGAGGQAGTGDAANLLKPALARGVLRTIGATTWSEYKRHIEKDPALTRRFQVLQVMEPDEARAVAMVRGLVRTFEAHHGVLIRDEAVRAAVRLSHRFIPSRQLPDKAISLLDTACARVGLSLHAPPAEVEHLRHELAAADAESTLLARESGLGRPDAARIGLARARREQLEADLALATARWERVRGLANDLVTRRHALVQSAPDGIEQQSTMHAGSGGGAGKATVSDLSFEHFIDRASPNLMKYCLTGKHINEAVLVVRKAGGNPLEYLKLTMTDVIVTRVSPKGSVDDEVRMREKVALSFSRVKQEYVVQNAQGGSGGAVTAGYDIKGNKEA